MYCGVVLNDVHWFFRLRCWTWTDRMHTGDTIFQCHNRTRINPYRKLQLYKWSPPVSVICSHSLRCGRSKVMRSPGRSRGATRGVVKSSSRGSIEMVWSDISLTETYHRFHVFSRQIRMRWMWDLQIADSLGYLERNRATADTLLVNNICRSC